MVGSARHQLAEIEFREGLFQGGQLVSFRQACLNEFRGLGTVVGSTF